MSKEPEKKPEAKVVDKAPEKKVDKSSPKLPPMPKPTTKKDEPSKKEKPKVGAEENLDTLGIIAVDGIGTKVMEKFKPIGIKTLEQLASASPPNIALLTKLPVHRLMEYQKKAEKILPHDQFICLA